MVNVTIYGSTMDPMSQDPTSQVIVTGVRTNNGVQKRHRRYVDPWEISSERLELRKASLDI